MTRLLLIATLLVSTTGCRESFWYPDIGPGIDDTGVDGDTDTDADSDTDSDSDTDTDVDSDVDTDTDVDLDVDVDTDTDTDTDTDPTDPDIDGDGFPASVDCNDLNRFVNPDADERCNGIDDDCDGTTDVNAIGMFTWNRDSDGDGYGDGDNTVEACDEPSGYVYNDEDCDDTTTLAYPGGIELCDGYDNDCNGDVDDVPENLLNPYYRDRDGDGWGDADTEGTPPVYACDPPFGYVEQVGDCDEAIDIAHPGMDELCGDPYDNNCDGQINEGC